MTEQEAEALAKRLERVWKPKHVSGQRRQYIRDKVFYFGGEIGIGVNFGFEVQEGRAPYAYLGWNKCEMECVRGDIDSNYVAVVEPEQWNVLLPEFDERWTPVFRRNCWLSGCDIEASAHEKAEWIQGFSREEIEAWNLKI